MIDDLGQSAIRNPQPVKKPVAKALRLHKLAGG
jgi:hypothetical protein